MPLICVKPGSAAETAHFDRESATHRGWMPTPAHARLGEFDHAA